MDYGIKLCAGLIQVSYPRRNNGKLNMEYGELLVSFTPALVCESLSKYWFMYMVQISDNNIHLLASCRTAFHLLTKCNLLAVITRKFDKIPNCD